MSKPVLIHVGFHKTGTTYLQEVVFADTRHFVQPWSRQFIYDRIIDPHELAFDSQDVREACAVALSRVPANVVPVLSEEGLCGNPFNGAREAGILARKIRATFDDARILLTVRSQPGMLRAVYIQYLKAYGRRGPAEFYDPPRFPEFSAFDPDIYRYDRLASLYAELFGAANVLALPQELLRDNESAFLRAIGDLVGTAHIEAPLRKHPARNRNVSPSPAGVPFLRLGNHFSQSAFNENGFGSLLSYAGIVLRSLGYKNTPFFRNKAGEFSRLVDGHMGRYTESNAALQRFCPVDLASLGYEMP